MKTILDKIVAHKKQEIEKTKNLIPVKKLEGSIYFGGPCISLSHYIQRNDKTGIIAEFKRSSPSRGDLNPYASADKIPLSYMQGGASALSILTDQKYFKGRNEDLTAAREWNFSPILRKEFIIDEYQIIEAKSIGADAILLILSILNEKEIKSFTKLAHDLGMEVLAEIHESHEFVNEALDADLLGINSRSLKEMKILENHTIKVKEQLALNKLTIAESGINSPEQALNLHNAGFGGFLIGSLFMKDPDPGFACRQFINQYTALLNQNKS
jgi:indole-3-glycerol phosphate synthase